MRLPNQGDRGESGSPTPLVKEGAREFAVEGGMTLTEGTNGKRERNELSEAIRGGWVVSIPGSQ